MSNCAIDPEKFLESLENAIKFWTSAQADPRGGDAVHLALREIRKAIMDSTQGKNYKIPRP